MLTLHAPHSRTAVAATTLSASTVSASTVSASTLSPSTLSPSTLSATAAPTTVRGPSLVPVKDGLWRVTGRSGTVLGHIERRTDDRGDRFAARRLIAATRTVDLGVFWRIDDAADCFR